MEKNEKDLKQNDEIIDETAEIEEKLDDDVLAAMDKALEEAEKEKSHEPTPGELLAQYIHEQSKQEKLVPLSVVTLSPPEGLTREQVKELFKDISADVALASVAIVKGKNDIYYYDSELMTEHYATVQSLIEDKDILATIAAAARHDCRIYPRPVRVLALMNDPYLYSMDEILGAIARMKGVPEYEDIDTVTASNGKMCIYSSKYMSKKYARALCEEMEVEWQLSQ